MGNWRNILLWNAINEEHEVSIEIFEDQLHDLPEGVTMVEKEFTGYENQRRLLHLKVKGETPNLLNFLKEYGYEGYSPQDIANGEFS